MPGGKWWGHTFALRAPTRHPRRRCFSPAQTETMLDFRVAAGLLAAEHVALADRELAHFAAPSHHFSDIFRLYREQVGKEMLQ